MERVQLLRENGRASHVYFATGIGGPAYTDVKESFNVSLSLLNR